jgi:predicted nuclease of predicted toxin-antitoxin system
MAASASKSKKLSGANSGSKPPEPPVFFLDRSLGKIRIATALRQAGAIVHVHDDYFPPDAKDETWLSYVGQHGWIVLTKDHRIRYRNLERAALMNAGVAAFILTAGDLQGEEMALIFVKALPAIAKFLTKHRKPFIAKVARNGSVSMLLQEDRS